MNTAYINLRLVIGLLITLCSTNTIADSPVWKVTKDDHHIYLGGTIHVLSKKDYPLPPAFEIAYKDSVELFFETDINAISSPERQALMQKVLISKDGTTIRNTISTETYQTLIEYLEPRQIPVEALNLLTPAGLSLTLMGIELQRLGLMLDGGVDHHFNSRSSSDGKQIGILETIEEQVSFINSLNDIDANLLISSTLQDLNNLSNEWPDLIAAWRSGDLVKLEEIGVKPMRDLAPSVYEVFLVNRNNKWMDDIETMFADKDIEFVLVGALHMAGEHGLIKQLKAANYEIVQLD